MIAPYFEKSVVESRGENGGWIGELAVDAVDDAASGMSSYSCRIRILSPPMYQAMATSSRAERACSRSLIKYDTMDYSKDRWEL